MKSNDYYNRIYKEAGAKMKKSLDSVKKVCDTFDSQNVRISVSKVGNECERLFGSPKQQSIRNNPLLKKYIDIRMGSQKIVGDIDFSGNKIKDPIIRSEFNLLEDEVNSLKLENMELKKLFQNIEVGMNQGKLEFHKEDSFNNKDIVIKLIKFLDSIGCCEYRGRYCLDKKVILSKKEFSIIKNFI